MSSRQAGKPNPKAEIKGLEEEVRALEQRNAELTVQLRAVHLQLAFWKENARQQENMVRMWQAMHSEAMTTMQKLGEAPIEFEAQAARLRNALDAPGQGVEALIAAVSLAAADTKAQIGRILPDLAPMLKRLKKAPTLPRTQGVIGASAERKAFRGG
jgi:SMC interacting uncharacterized protein involved in chromosome segregation